MKRVTSTPAARRWARAVTSLVAAATVAFPATAFATSLNAKIPNGYYATLEVAHVPGGEDLSFTLVAHQDLRALTLTCAPNATIAKLVQGSGYADVFVLTTVKQITLINGAFHFAGVAAVSSTPKLAGKVASTTFTVKGSYVHNGPTYHYTGSIGNKVTATLVFQGTATSSACVGLPANHVFRLYVTRSVA